MSRFDETIKKMQEITGEISEKAADVTKLVDEETASKIKAVSNKTIDVINEAAVKLKEATEKVSDDSEMDKFLDRVVEKCEKAREYAFVKIDELTPEEVNDADYVGIDEDKKDSMEQFLENENVKGAVNMLNAVKDKAVAFMSKPEIKEKSDKAKLAVLNAADKGLDYLLKVLNK